MRRAATCIVLALAAVLVVTPSAWATFPGANGGKIAYQWRDCCGDIELYIANADGSGQVHVGPEGDRPDWSANGAKLAYVAGNTIHVVNASNTGNTTILSHSVPVRAVAWSPDGTQLAYIEKPLSGCSNAVRVVNGDGTGDALLRSTEDCRVLDLDWGSDGRLLYSTEITPGGSRRLFIATPSDPPATPLPRPGTDFVDWAPGQKLIALSNADGGGTERVSLEDYSSTGWPLPEAVWSPDGSRIAGTTLIPSNGARSIAIATDAGTGITPITPANGLRSGSPAWQPLPPLPPQPGYPRPLAATPIHASLVPAYEACTSRNRVHAAPLSFNSCNPPQPRSQYLTVGSPDSNGAAANYTGSLRLNSVLGNSSTPADEADVGITVHLTDIRCQTGVTACTGGAMSDYTGQVTALLAVRITDKQNGGTVAQPATGSLPNFKLPARFAVQCTPTADAAIGSSCDITTSIDALTPNAVKEGMRSIWELDQILISDGGLNGDPTEFAETPFLTQGLFVP